jgi:non-ribosomal peptide synthetase component F
LHQNYQIKPDTLIGICIERSLDMAIALLAVLKAGAAYVPIDSNYPEERIKYILENSKISLLLTQSFINDKLSEFF